MSKKQLIKPLPAINQRQRLRLLNCVDKYKKVSQAPAPSVIIDSLMKVIAKENKVKKSNIKKSESSTSLDLLSTIDSQINKSEPTDSFKMSATNQNNQTSSFAMDKSLRVFYHKKRGAKKLQVDFTDNEDIILAMQRFEESKKSSNLMLRLGLSDVIFNFLYFFIC